MITHRGVCLNQSHHCSIIFFKSESGKRVQTPHPLLETANNPPECSSSLNLMLMMLVITAPVLRSKTSRLKTHTCDHIPLLPRHQWQWTAMALPPPRLVRARRECSSYLPLLLYPTPPIPSRSEKGERAAKFDGNYLAVSLYSGDAADVGGGGAVRVWLNLEGQAARTGSACLRQGTSQPFI